MILLIGLGVYCLISLIMYFVFQYLYKTDKLVALPNVSSSWIYYVLQFTWGLLLNVVGGIAYLVISNTKKGRPPYKYGWNWYCEVEGNFGLNLGVFCFVSPHATRHTRNHEHGHGIQNIWFGPFYPMVAGLPSVVRYWIRRLRQKMGWEIKSNYDDAWFEGQATQTGELFMEDKR